MERVLALLIRPGILLSGLLSLACTCTRGPFDEQTVALTPFIVVGQVWHLRYPDIDHDSPFAALVDSTHGYTADIKIKTSYKGGLHEGERIVVTSGGSNCDLQFSLGGMYLLLFDIDGDTYRMWPCGYSQLLGEWSNDELEVIKRMVPNQPASVAINDVVPIAEETKELAEDKEPSWLQWVLGLLLCASVILVIIKRFE